MIRSLIVSGANCAPLLSHRIAGLTLFERILRTAKRAGIPQIHLVVSEPFPGHPALPRELILKSPEQLLADPSERYVLLQCGYVPDVDLLAWLGSSGAEGIPGPGEEQPICSSFVVTKSGKWPAS